MDENNIVNFPNQEMESEMNGILDLIVSTMDAGEELSLTYTDKMEMDLTEMARAINLGMGWESEPNMNIVTEELILLFARLKNRLSLEDFNDLKNVYRSLIN